MCQTLFVPNTASETLSAPLLSEAGYGTRWEQEESLKPAHLRRPLPEAPSDVPIMTQDYNDAAYARYNDQALEACPHCARTFLPDRLQVQRVTGLGGSRRSP